MAERLNPRRQGELGELSAIEWLTWAGATVFTPLGHSPDVDLVADFGRGPLRIEVKTTCTRHNGRWQAAIKTCGGNQSWNRIVKTFDPERCDYLFIHVADGRRWLIPAPAVDGGHSITLGGRKYEEYEIDRGRPLLSAPPLQSRVPLGECQSGQMERAVNASAYAYGGSNPPSPIATLKSPFVPTKYDRKPGQRGETHINAKRKVTLPQGPVIEAGLNVGDRLRARSAGYGRVILERIEPLTTPSGPEPEEAA